MMNLPLCRLGHTITVTDHNGNMKGVKVTKDMINPLCTCKLEKEAYFCDCGGKGFVCNRGKSKRKAMKKNLLKGGGRK